MIIQDIVSFQEFDIQPILAEDLPFFLDCLQSEFHQAGICGLSDSVKEKKVKQWKDWNEKREKSPPQLGFSLLLSTFEKYRAFFRVDFVIPLWQSLPLRRVIDPCFGSFGLKTNFSGMNNYVNQETRLTVAQVKGKVPLSSELSDSEKVAKIATFYSKVALDWLDNLCNSDERLVLRMGFDDSRFGFSRTSRQRAQGTSFRDLCEIARNESKHPKLTFSKIDGETYAALRGPAKEVLDFALRHVSRTQLLNFTFGPEISFPTDSPTESQSITQTVSFEF